MGFNVNTRKQILIVGTDHEPNYGDQAIFSTMVGLLRETVSGVKFVVHSQNPDGTRRLISRYLAIEDRIELSAINYQVVPNNVVKFLNSNIYFDKAADYIIKNVNLHDYHSSDMVILVGGGSKIAEGQKETPYNLLSLLVARRIGKPAVLYFQSVGPFRTKRFKKIVSYILNQANLILLRESISENKLKTIGVMSNILRVGADSAFCLTPEINTQKILDKEKICFRNKTVVGICPGAISTDIQENSNYCRIIANVLDILIRNYCVDILFIYTRGAMSSVYPDDFETILRIYELMRYKEKAHIIKGDYDCSIIAGLIGNCKILIGLRMHSLIFALINNVPIVPLSVYYKTGGVLNTVYYPLKDLSIREINESTLLQKFSVIWKDQEKIREEISSNVIRLKEEVKRGIKTIEKIMFEDKLVYVIILTFNGKEWIDNCLTSVMSTNYSNYKILVVDNASCDGSADYTDSKFPQVELIRNKKNYGFAEGNNIGMRYALKKGAEFIVLLNQDTKVDSNWISELVRVAEQDNTIGILSPMQYDYEGKEIDGNFLKNIRENNIPADSVFIKTDKVIGAAMFIKKSVLLRIGLFDPIYFCYGEEVDFYRRAIFHGFKVGIVCISQIYHWHSLLHREQKSRRMKNILIRNELINQLKDPNKSFVRNLGDYFKWKFEERIFNNGLLFGSIKFVLFLLRQSKILLLFPLIILRRKASV